MDRINNNVTSNNNHYDYAISPATPKNLLNIGMDDEHEVLLPLPRFNLLKLLHDNARTTVYRATRREDGLPVIIKIIKDNSKRSAEEVANKQLEISNLLRTYGVKGVASIIEIEKLDSLQDYGVAVVMEDCGGESLEDIINKRTRLSIQECIEIGIAIANILSNIHKRFIIHNDIKPSNIIMNMQTREINLVDFEISDCLEKDESGKTNTGLKGSLEYISPEQTGRVKRKVDFRSDLYSLGITLFRLVTGRLPFTCDSWQESIMLIHAHIAMAPPNPCELNPSVPYMLAQVILKLLEKDPDKRYQSAYGLAKDLQRCLDDLRLFGEVHTFQLGQVEKSSIFRIPDKIYGRDKEIKQLLAAFNRVQRGGPAELVTISGYSGIGKTSLIRQCQPEIRKAQGNLLIGKLDQYQKDAVPFNAFIQALNEFVMDIISKSSEEISVWGELLRSALGPNAAVITEVMPDLKLIIGDVTPEEEHQASAQQVRLFNAFVALISSFASEQHPLVITLDDMHLAGHAMLRLLKHIMKRAEEIKYLLLIVAYRDNEVDDRHPLILTLNELEREISQKPMISASDIIASSSGSNSPATSSTSNELPSTRVTKLVLSPLTLADMNQFVSDVTHTSLEDCADLAKMVYHKTAANPFFAQQFVKTLHQEGLLTYDEANICWEWQMSRIESQGYTDNIIEFLYKEMSTRLSGPTLHLISLAACIGNKFDLSTLHSISDLATEGETYQILSDAVAHGYILVSPTESRNASHPTQFQFLHDRVQQAAHDLLSDEAKAKAHAAIGELLLKRRIAAFKAHDSHVDYNDDVYLKAHILESPDLFAITKQLNAGASAFTTIREKVQLAKFNLWTGLKSKDITAFEAAATCFETTLVILAEVNNGSEPDWNQHYDLLFSCYLAYSEVEALLGNWQHAEELLLLMLDNAKDIFDKVVIINARITMQESQARYSDAFKIGMDCLALLEAPITKVPPPEYTDELFRKVESLIEARGGLSSLYSMAIASTQTDNLTHEQKALTAQMQTLASMTIPAFRTLGAPGHFVAAAGIQIALEHSLFTKFFPVLLVWHGFNLSERGDYQNGFLFCELACDLAEHFGEKSTTASVRFIHEGMVFYRLKPLRKTVEKFETTFQIATSAGNYAFAAYAALFIVAYKVFSGYNLRVCQDEIVRYKALIMKKFQMPMMAEVVNSLGFFVYPLLGTPIDTSDSSFSKKKGQRKHKTMSLPKTEVEEEATPSIFQEEEYEKFIGMQPPNIRANYYAFRALCMFILGDLQRALYYCEAVQTNIQGVWGVYTFYEHHFTYSLVLAALYPTLSSEEEKSKYISMIRASQLALAPMAEHSPSFKFKHVLIEAELCNIIGGQQNVERACYLYSQAIQLAADNEFIQFVAIGSELAAKFYHRNHMPKMAQLHFTDAAKHYYKWGSEKKVSALMRRYGAYLRNFSITTSSSGSSGSSSSEGTTSTDDTHLRTTSKSTNASTDAGLSAESDTTIDSVATRFDTTAIIKASQALSSEIVLDKLLSDLIRIVTTNSGASQGSLILLGNDNRLTVECSYETHRHDAPATAAHIGPISFEECEFIPHSIVGFVARTLKPLVINDATEERPWVVDPYVVQHKPISILCAPIIHKAKLFGIFYLENRLSRGVFTQERLTMLNLLSSQVAISVENARLVHRLTTYSKDLEKLASHLEDLQERNRGILDTAVDGIIMLDEAGRIQTFNKSAQRIFGYEESEVLGKDFSSLVSTTAGSPPAATLQGLVGRGIEFIGQCADGKTFPAELHLSVLRLHNQVFYVGIIRDITEIKKGLEFLIQAKQAEAENKAKSLWISSMSHEIRNPLNGIVGINELLLTTKLSKEQREYVTASQSAVELLQTIINDILDFSKIEAGKVELQNVSFDIVHEVESVVDFMSPAAFRKGLEFIMFISPEIPRILRGDSTRFRQIIINLISNSIKFTSSGCVVLNIEYISTIDREVRFYVSVSDTGLGVPEDSRDKLFKAFSQVDGAQTTRKYGGTGLGLVVCKQLVELMKGEIGYKANTPRGSTFWFTVCMEYDIKNSYSMYSMIKNTCSTKKILVVDKCEEVRTCIARYLSYMDCNVSTAAAIDSTSVMTTERSSTNAQPFVDDAPDYRSYDFVLINQQEHNPHQEPELQFKLPNARWILLITMGSKFKRKESIESGSGSASSDEGGRHISLSEFKYPKTTVDEPPAAVPMTASVPQYFSLQMDYASSGSDGDDDEFFSSVLVKPIKFSKLYETITGKEFPQQPAVGGILDVNNNDNNNNNSSSSSGNIDTTSPATTESTVNDERSETAAVTTTTTTATHRHAKSVGSSITTTTMTTPTRLQDNPSNSPTTVSPTTTVDTSPAPAPSPATTMPLSAPQRETTEQEIFFEPDLNRSGVIRVLLAEDNELNQKVCSRMIQKEGYECDVATDGVDAVEMVKRKEYNLVLMDIVMITMDGLTATREIRKMTHLKHKSHQVPIIALSANVSNEDQAACYAAGMSDVCGKPVTRARLLDVINKWAHRTHDPEAAAAAAASYGHHHHQHQHQHQQSQQQTLSPLPTTPLSSSSSSSASSLSSSTARPR